jgi:hypothetical protein
MTLNPNNSIGSVPDPKSSKLRATIAAIERDLSRLPPEIVDGGGVAAVDGLRASVAELVRQLALGPEPAYRQCPVCQHILMRGATVCGYCWTKLAPLQEPSTARM